MGKPTSFCVDDHLQKMSSSSVKTQCVTENVPSTSDRGGDAEIATRRNSSASTSSLVVARRESSTITTAPVVCDDTSERKEPIPKLYISKSLLRQPSSSGSTSSSYVSGSGKRKMVDTIMRRLSIGPESMREAEKTLNYASKVFRKRASSSSYELGPKIQVIDNSQPVPGMLPTPVVHSRMSSSAGMSVFKSDACETVLRKYNTPHRSSSASSSSAVSPVAAKDEPKRELKILSSPVSRSSSRASSPEHSSGRPKLKTPPLNEFFRKPRTVAEKRMFLLQSPIEYKVLDFENSVYHLIKKAERFKDDATFRTQVELLLYSTAPTNRSIWKAVLWLNSEVGGYQPWHLNIDGEHLRLLGATGTLVLDDLEPIVTRGLIAANRQYQPGYRPIWCCATFRLRKLKNEPAILAQLESLGAALTRREGDERTAAAAATQKLIGKRTAEMASMKPAPLSRKVRRMEMLQRRASHLGPLEIYELPVKRLIASPELNKKQPPNVCAYLKLALPDEKMTTDWLNYSLSVLQAPSAIPAAIQEGVETAAAKPTASGKMKFKFSIPYKNDQRKILVRRVNCRKRGEWRTENHDEQMKYELTFPAVAREKCGDEEELNPEVETILTEMINSVAISFSEDFFVRDDPDLSYTAEKVMKVPTASGDSAAGGGQGVRIRKRRQSEWTSLRSELRRLDVNIIDTAKIGTTVECTKEECRFGCVCESISRLDGLSNHCTKVECIFECKCTAEEVNEDEEKQLRRMRDENMRCLAPVEKEFRSTVVLTNSNTILMSNSEDRKRNRTKPKRYFDYKTTNSGEESGGEGGAVAGASGVQAAVRLKEKRRMAHPDVERMRHCAVVLPNIAQLELLEPWCMVHELYRCFCDNKRIEGRPFKLHTGPDGTIRANVKETLMLNSRRRPVTFAKDESQDALERLPVQPRQDNYCSRCTPTDFSDQFLKNKINSELVATKARLADRVHVRARLDMLVEQCLNVDLQGRQRRSQGKLQLDSRTQEQKSAQRQQCIEEAGNELGLKIASVFTLENEENVAGDSGGGVSEVLQQPPQQPEKLKHRTVRYPEPEVCFEERLRVLKQRLLVKLNLLLESCSNTILHPPGIKKVNFVRYNDFKSCLLQNTLAEVLAPTEESGVTGAKAECIILAPNLKVAEEYFPKNRLVPVTNGQDSQFYLSKFVADDSSKLQSKHIFIVVEGSGDSFWFVRGCQYIKDPQNRISIQTCHTDQLREYAHRSETMMESNLDIYHLLTSGHGVVDLRLPVADKTRYLMLELCSDFSDIGHPRWKGLLSYKHIRQALDLAQKQQKTIKVIRGPSDMRPNIYATPQYSKCVFAGPYMLDEPCSLNVYQRMDNSLYMREEYETMLNIQREKPTSGYWLTNNQLSAAGDPARRLDQRRLSSPAEAAAAAVAATAAATVPSTTTAAGAANSLQPKILPELEIVSLNRAARIKTERDSNSESERASVSITTAKRSDSTTGSRSLLKSLLRGNEPAQVASGGGERSSSPQISINLPSHATPPTPPTIAMNDAVEMSLQAAMRDPDVSSFRVGNTIVKRRDTCVDNAIPGTSSAPDPPAPTGRAAAAMVSDDYESDDDDVMLIEDDQKIIDLDEWEKEMSEEGSDEEDEEEEEEAAAAAVSVNASGAQQVVGGNVAKQSQVAVPAAKKSPTEFDASIPSSGYYRSNIPGLGNIPAKILNGIITLSLPIRKMPIKIGVDCVNRYMWKYLQNSVAACFPQDLKVEWEFVNSFFPTAETLFKLDPSSSRNSCILTKYGIFNVVTDIKTEQDIPDPSLYLKYLASRLCVLVFNKLGVYTANEIISQTLLVIKQERYKLLKNNRELTFLTMRRVDLQNKLTKLSEEQARGWRGAQ